jgi:trehalose 2-sulfotransferase
MTVPTASYLICATPRSGSTLLCDLLARTGVAGHPEEHFQALPETGRQRGPRDYLGPVFADPAVRAAVGHRPPDEAPAGSLETVLERGTTPNGMFGGKIMWPYLAGLVERLPGDGPALEVLRGTFPELRLIHHTRLDRVRQAISLWRAVQTWSWRHHPGAAPSEAIFHRGAIEHLAWLLDEEDAAWERFFAGAGIEPIRVVYEDLVADPAQTVAGLLDALGLPVPAGAGARTGLARQADELSEDWAARCL